jgi:hypothetical protein
MLTRWDLQAQVTRSRQPKLRRRVETRAGQSMGRAGVEGEIVKRPLSRLAAGIAALFLCGAAYAVALDVNVGVTVDADGGRGIDLDLGASPTQHLSFNLGAGYATGTDTYGSLGGTTLAGGAALHSDHLGLALDYDQFDAPANYHVATVGARGWFELGDLRVTLLARSRDSGVELRLDLPRRTLRREMHFSALGAGVQLAYSHDNLSVYGMTLRYEYDDDFTRFLALPNGPLAERRPRIEALYGSFILQAQGAIDRQFALGSEFTFGNQALAIDLARLHDAVADANSTSVALTWRYLRSAHYDWSVTAGMVDSAVINHVAFLSLAFGLHN